MSMPTDLYLNHVHVLTPAGWLPDTTLQVSGGRIVALGEEAERRAEAAPQARSTAARNGPPEPGSGTFASGEANVVGVKDSLDPRPGSLPKDAPIVGYGSTIPNVIDAPGHWVLPGIIDLHGDAFERDITPRAGTEFPLDLALAANDANLVAHGITLFYYSITDGFEPGPRNRATVRRLLATLDALAPRFACQSRVHIRHERVNTEDHEELLAWIAAGRIHLLSLNDHLPPLDQPAKIARYLAGLRRRVAMSDTQAGDFLATRQASRALGAEQTRDLVAQAHRHGVPLASHDDESLADIEHNRTLGTRIAEFPMSAAVAEAAREAGIAVLMGAPNLVRGGSHVGAIGVKQALEAGLVDILCSDYHYTSLLHAPFLAARLGLMTLPEAWRLVSENPARAAGLGDRKGRIEVGFDADLLIFDALDGLPTSLRHTLIGGKVVYRRMEAGG